MEDIEKMEIEEFDFKLGLAMGSPTKGQQLEGL